MSEAGLKAALWLLVGAAVLIFGTWGYGRIQRSDNAALDLEIAKLKAAIAIGNAEANRRVEASKAEAKAQHETDQRGWNLALLRMADQQADRSRAHDSLVERMRNALAARESRRSVCRPGVPAARVDPGTGIAPSVQAGRDRAGSDGDPAERSARFVERASAINDAYTALLEQIQAGNCPVIESGASR